MSDNKTELRPHERIAVALTRVVETTAETDFTTPDRFDLDQYLEVLTLKKAVEELSNAVGALELKHRGWAEREALRAQGREDEEFVTKKAQFGNDHLTVTVTPQRVFNFHGDWSELPAGLLQKRLTASEINDALEDESHPFHEAVHEMIADETLEPVTVNQVRTRRK